MAKVFLVEHLYELDGCEYRKFIGIFSTEAKAESAVEKLKAKYGFKDHKDGFWIGDVEIDHEYWQSGFSTICFIQVRLLAGAWKTTQAELLKDGNYCIIEDFYEDDSMQEFRGGDIVRCESRFEDGIECLYAVEKVG